jgi:hypothetical protein
MKTRRLLIVTGAVIVALIALSNAARHQVMKEPLMDGDNVLFRDHYSLSNRVEGALFVMAQTIELTNDSQVEGDTALVGKTVTIAGDIEGDLMATGSEVRLDSSSEIDGDVILIGKEIILAGAIDGDIVVTGGSLTIADGTNIDGELTVCGDTINDGRADAGQIHLCSTMHSSDLIHAGGGAGFNNSLLNMSISALFSTLLLGGLGGLAVTFFPAQISHIEEAVRSRPRDMVLSGLMIDLAAIGVGALFVVVLAAVPPLGVILLPIMALLGLVYVGMALAGWVTIALVIGEWLLDRASQHQPSPPLVTVAVGSFALAFVLHIVALIPLGAIVSFLAFAVIGVVAVGAAFMTRMGTRPLHRSYFVQG